MKKKKAMQTAFRVFAVVIFLFGIVGLLANLATPFVFLYYSGVTFWNVVKGLALWGLLDLFASLIAVVGLLMNCCVLNS